MIAKRPDGYCVYSEDGTKRLGGPYATREEAEQRLAQVEAAKAAGGASLLPKKKGPKP